MQPETITSNSIAAPEYADIKKYLDDMLVGKICTIDDFRKIENIPQSICALFVAMKDEKYREKALYILDQLIRIHTFDDMSKILQSEEMKSYKISSTDISSDQRKAIVAHMFSKLPDPDFHAAIIYSMGFYLTPDVLDVLEEYMKSDNPIIKQEAEYAVEHIKRKLDALRKG